RDVESMVRDLVETSVRLVKEEKMLAVKEKAEANANNRLVEILVPAPKRGNNFKNPLEMLFGGNMNQEENEANQQEEYSIQQKRNEIREKLARGELENEMVTIEVEESTPSMFDLLQGSGMEQMGVNM